MSALQSIVRFMSRLASLTVSTHRRFWSHLHKVWNSPFELQAASERGNQLSGLLVFPAFFFAVVYLAIGVVAGLLALTTWDLVVSVLETLALVALVLTGVFVAASLLTGIGAQVADTRRAVLLKQDDAERMTQEEFDAVMLDPDGKLTI